MSFFNSINDCLCGRLDTYYCGILMKKQSSQLGSVYLPLIGKYYDLTAKQVIALREDVNAYPINCKGAPLSGLFVLSDILTEADLSTKLGSPLTKVDEPNL